MSGLDRRQFLTRSAAVLGSAGLGAVVGAVSESQAQASPVAQSATDQARATLAREIASRVPFDAQHQSGVLTPAPAQASFVALDSIAPSRGMLEDALRNLSVRARSLTQGDTVGAVEVDDPPPDSGILGPQDAPDQLTVTLAFGASLFDGRYGLAARRPRQLTPMPNFANDELDPTRTHGDVLLQVCAGQRDTVVHTVRELMRSVVGHLTPRWKIEGFQSAARGPSPRSNPRNLFAFRDGTANPDVDDASLMNRLLWVGGDGSSGGEPAWAAGGTYQVVRTIRMHVEFWDRVGMFEQENMIGRQRVTGAPLGGSEEFEDPRYDLDPHGKRIPLDAHIRLANPRTAATEDQRILRRGYNYDRGLDEAGDLDQGLVFVAFNQDIQRQFATIQNRLSEEPMIDYITPVGGGYFFAPRGSKGPGDWVGSGLFAA
jgi:deferrochelatase/peroxidase EfeB